MPSLCSNAVGEGVVLLPTSLVKDWGPLGTWWKITSVRDKGKTVQGLESYQLSRKLSSSWGQAPQASQVDAHLGGLFDLKMHPLTLVPDALPSATQSLGLPFCASS